MIQFTRKAINSLKTLSDNDANQVQQILELFTSNLLDVLPPNKRPMLLKTDNKKNIYVAKVTQSLRLVFTKEDQENVLVIDMMNHDRMSTFFKTSVEP